MILRLLSLPIAFKNYTVSRSAKKLVRIEVIAVLESHLRSYLVILGHFDFLTLRFYMVGGFGVNIKYFFKFY